MREGYKIALYGTICNDLQIANTSTGKKYARVNISITNVGKKKDGTEYNHVEYFNCVAWEKIAEEIVTDYQKGNKISLECSRTISEYVNKQGVSVKDWSLNIKKVNEVVVDNSEEVSKPKTQAPQPKKASAVPPKVEDAEDDMPF